MPKRTTDFREDLLVDLTDSAEAARYLNAALEDSDQMALVALRDVAEARQMARVAEEAGVAREALYRMLHESGNPTYVSLMGILGALGLRIEFAPIDSIGDSLQEPVEPAAAAVYAVNSTGAGMGGLAGDGNGPKSNTEGAPCRDAGPIVRCRRRKIQVSSRRRGKAKVAAQKRNSRTACPKVAVKGLGASVPRTLAIAS
jgi:probable addiction module antidote protein